MAAKFHERFEIDVGVQDARRRFAARVANLVFEQFFYYHLSDRGSAATQYRGEAQMTPYELPGDRGRLLTAAQVAW